MARNPGPSAPSVNRQRQYQERKRRRKPPPSPGVEGERAKTRTAPPRPPQRTTVTPPDQQDRQRQAQVSATPPDQQDRQREARGPGGATLAPRPRPSSALQREKNYHGNVFDFSRRLGAFTTAHEEHFGYRPSPGFALDVAASQVPEEQFADLFGMPKSKRGMPIPSITKWAQTDMEPFSEEEEEEGLIELAGEKLRRGDPAEMVSFWNEYGERIEDITKRNKKLAARLSTLKATSKFETPGMKAAALLPLPGEGNLDPFGEYVAGPLTATFAGLLTGPPALALQQGIGIKKSVEQSSLDPLLQTQRQLAGQVVEGVKQTYKDPAHNWPFIFMDVLGVTSLVAGGAARTGAALRGQSPLKKPRGGVVEYRRPGSEGGVQVVHQPLSENMAINKLQRMKAWAMNKRVAKRAQSNDDTIPPGGVRRIMQQYFSTEAKIGRLSKAEARVQRKIDEAPKREFEFAANASNFRIWMSRKTERMKLGPWGRGLSVGGQKALQVRFTDLEGGDKAKVARWREFHENMIEMAPAVSKELGAPIDLFIREHQAQLAALKLAEKALKKPSKKFLRAEQLAREVEAETTAKRIEHFGLSPGTATSAVAKPGEVVRTGRKLEPGEKLERVSTSSIRVKYESRAKARKDTTVQILGARAGDFGIPPVAQSIRRLLPELYHEMTGNSLRMGDFRIDTTNLIGEQYGRTVRAVAMLHTYNELLKGATKTRKSDFDIAIRVPGTKGVSDDLKRVLSKLKEGELDADDVAYLSSGDADVLRAHLFPDKDAVASDEFMWVDGRIVGGQNVATKLQGTPEKVFGQLFNEPFRIAYLYPRPAYALNAVGNAFMLMMEQGPWMGNNMLRSLNARKLYGDRVLAALDELSGNSKSRSFVNMEIETRGAAVGKWMAQGWHRLVDGWMRRAALIHELQRQGFKGQKGFEAALFDKRYKTQLYEAVERANGAMVKFDNLTDFEKAYARNILFVYPWVSRSLVWSFRTLAEHPVKSAIFAHVGQETLDDMDEVFDKAPEWFKRTGYLPIGWDDDGNPKVINPTGVNTFSTLSQLMTVGESLFIHDVGTAGFQDIASPQIQFMTRLVSGRDEYGNPLPGPDFFGAFGEMVRTIPQFRAWQRSQGRPEEKVERDITDRDTLIRERRAALNRMVFSPGWLNGWGMLINPGGAAFTPRSVDLEALEARFWRDQPLEERHKMEAELIREALKLQSEFLKRPLGPQVKKAVDVAIDFDHAKKQWQAEYGAFPTPRQQDELLLDTLQEKALISADEVKAERKKIDKNWQPNQHESYRSLLLGQYGGGEELEEWDRDVRDVYSFRREVLQGKLDILAANKVISKRQAPKDQEALFETGRRYVTWKKQRERLKDAAQEAGDSVEADRLYADYRAWLEEQDTEQGGLPSFVRLAYLDDYRTPKARVQHLANTAAGRWDILDPLEKEMLGRKAPYAKAWAVYENAIADFKNQAPLTDVRLQKDQLLAVAKQVNRQYPGFIRDWDFSRKPLARRLGVLNVVSKSRNKSNWLWLLGEAEKVIKATEPPPGFVGTTKGDANEAWRRWIPGMREWVRENWPAFDKELAVYEEQSPSFVYDFLR